MNAPSTYNIGELAAQFGISTRSIRFYEEKGLLSPARTNGGYRLYSKRDRVRLRLILRGKRFGLSLEEIAEILGFSSVDMDEAEQIKKAMAYGSRIVEDLDRRMADLKAMKREMKQLEIKMKTRLAQLE